MTTPHHAPQSPQLNARDDVHAAGGDPTNLELPLYGASPKDAIIRFFKRYAKFQGRSSRSEYWWANLLTMLPVIFLSAIAGSTGKTVTNTVTTETSFRTSAQVTELSDLGNILMAIVGIYLLAILVPSIASTVRRLHDGNMSGWLYLLSLIPVLGGLIVLILTVLPSNPAGQRFDAPHGR